ncbi:MAG: histidinol-phosphate transaminase [Fimbriimonas sp.]
MHLDCFHGGAFWDAIGADFTSVEKRHDVVAADVLDAWFPPAPAVLEGLRDLADWTSRTSPPTHAEGLKDAIALWRNLLQDSIIVGPGSSAILYAALGEWLSPGSRVCLTEPSYGEYAHFCAHVVPCDVQRVTATAADGFRLDVDEWIEAIVQHRADLAVLVRPNNPTGTTMPLHDLRAALGRIPPFTRVLVDEAYIDYTPATSAETLLADYPNLFVLKSLSKCYALSGLRVGYLAGDLGRLARKVPPWWVSLPAQLAAVRALMADAYYTARYAETALLRNEMVAQVGVRCHGGANWLLLPLPTGARSSEVVELARQNRVFVRDAGRSAPSLEEKWIRCAVRSRAENERSLGVLQEAIASCRASVA